MITKILQKYEGFANYWYPEVKESNVYQSPKIEEYRKGCAEKESALQQKWKPYIEKGWYGFGLGSPCPHDWYNILDEFLEYFAGLEKEEKIEDFKILQVKVKMGSIRYYITYKCQDEEFSEFLRLQINKLESCLYDEKLIY